MNIFLRELRFNRRALIIWCVCMAAGVAAGMSKYTAYSGSSAGLDVFKQMPYSVRALLGIGDLDVTKMPGYFAFLLLYLELAAAAHAVLLGSGIVSKEERDKTAEFLIPKPVSRLGLMGAKLLAALFNVVCVNLVTLVSSLAFVSKYNKGADISGEILNGMAALLIVQLIFLALGFFVAAFIRDARAAGAVSGAVLVATFVVAELTSVTDRLNFLNILSPFKYFSATRLASGSGPEPLNTVLSLALCAALSAAALARYRTRDLQV